MTSEWTPPGMTELEREAFDRGIESVGANDMGLARLTRLAEYIAREVPAMQAEILDLGMTLALAVETTEAQRRYIDELEAKLKPQPIETAPKNGTRIELWFYTQWVIGAFLRGQWCDDEGTDLTTYPPTPLSHWRPLPPAPEVTP